MPTRYLKDSDIAVQDHAREQQLPITIRRCLQCGYWMRSTGSGNQRCNECKGLGDKPAYWKGGQRLSARRIYGSCDSSDT